MSANELVALLGLAWSRLLFYPAGLVPFALIWLLATASNLIGWPGNRSAVWPLAPGRALSRSRWSAVGLSAIITPWLGLALLPLPSAAPLSRQTDLIVVLALLEWPRLVTIAYELRSAREVRRRAGVRRLAATLNSYPLVILATLALAQPAGSFEIVALTRSPAESAVFHLKVLHWLGAIAWVLILPLLLGLGPFRADEGAVLRRPVDEIGWGLALRAYGLVALAVLLCVAPLGALEQEGHYSTGTRLAIVLVPLGMCGMLWFYDRSTVSQSARRWAYMFLLFAGVLLFALLLSAYGVLQR